MPRPGCFGRNYSQSNHVFIQTADTKLPAIRLPARGVIERAANRSLVFTSLERKFSGSLMAAGCWRQNGFVARTGLHILLVVAVPVLILLINHF